MNIRMAMIKRLGVLGLLGLGGCVHVAGQVLNDRTKQPMTAATLTVGRPDGLGTFVSHHVNDVGKFDFYISPTDEDFLYVWDGKGDPQVNVRRVDRATIGDHMVISIPESENNF